MTRKVQPKNVIRSHRFSIIFAGPPLPSKLFENPQNFLFTSWPNVLQYFRVAYRSIFFNQELHGKTAIALFDIRTSKVFGNEFKN